MARKEKIKEKTKLFHKNGVFSLEYDKETLRDMVLEYQVQQKEFIEYLEDESKKIYRDFGLRQNIFREILSKYKEIIGDDK